MLGAEMYGVVGVAMAVLLYFNRMADAGLDLVGMREIAGERSRAVPIAQSVLGFRIVLSVALTLLLAAGALLWLPSPDGMVLAVLALTLIPVGVNTRFVHLGFERGEYAATARVAGEAIVLVLLVVLVRTPYDVLRVPLAQLLGTGAAAAMLAWWMRAYAIPVRARLDWAVLRPLLRRSAHIVGAAVLGLIAFNSDLIILRYVHGAETAGYYAAAYMPISLAINLGLAYRMSLLPALSRLAPTPELQRGLYHTALAHVFAAVAPTAFAGMLLAPAAILFLFGGAYAPAGPVLQLLIWAIPLAQLREPAVAALVAARREDRLLHQNAVGTAVNLALNVLLIPRYGMMGAAIATVATEAVRFALAVWFARAVGFRFAGAERFWRVAGASAAMTLALLALGRGHFLVGAGTAVAVYGLTLFLLGGISMRRGELPVLSV
jgi:O-antigen/teichoic acid export membrane protein